MSFRPSAAPSFLGDLRRRRPCLLAGAVFAVCMAGTTLPTPLYGLYQEKFDFSELTVTVVYAVYALGVMGVLLLAGNASDAVGRRPVLWWGLGFAAASAVCFLCATALGWLYVGRLLSGLSAGPRGCGRSSGRRRSRPSWGSGCSPRSARPSSPTPWMCTTGR